MQALSVFDSTIGAFQAALYNFGIVKPAVLVKAIKLMKLLFFLLLSPLLSYNQTSERWYQRENTCSMVLFIKLCQWQLNFLSQWVRFVRILTKFRFLFGLHYCASTKPNFKPNPQSF